MTTHSRPAAAMTRGTSQIDLSLSGARLPRIVAGATSDDLTLWYAQPVEQWFVTASGRSESNSTRNPGRNRLSSLSADPKVRRLQLLMPGRQHLRVPELMPVCQTTSAPETVIVHK